MVHFPAFFLMTPDAVFSFGASTSRRGPRVEPLLPQEDPHGAAPEQLPPLAPRGGHHGGRWICFIDFDGKHGGSAMVKNNTGRW